MKFVIKLGIVTVYRGPHVVLQFLHRWLHFGEFIPSNTASQLNCVGTAFYNMLLKEKQKIIGDWEEDVSIHLLTLKIREYGDH